MIIEAFSSCILYKLSCNFLLDTNAEHFVLQSSQCLSCSSWLELLLIRRCCVVKKINSAMTSSFFPLSVLKDFLERKGSLKGTGFVEMLPVFLQFTQLLNIRACCRYRTQMCLRASAPTCQGCRQVLNYQMLPSRYLRHVQQEGMSQRLVASVSSLCQPGIQGESLSTMNPTRH